MPKQEGEQLLTRTHQVHRCIHAGSDQVTKRFVRSVWNPDGRQVAGTVQDRQLLRITPIGLDPLARLARDHRWRDHDALVPKRSELAMDAVPATARFVAEVELPVLRESLRHLGDIVCRVRNHSQEPYRAVPPSSATLIEMVSLWTSIPTNDLTVCMSLILLSTGEPKARPDSKRDIQTQEAWFPHSADALIALQGRCGVSPQRG